MSDENIKLTIDPAACLLKIKMPDGTIRKIEPKKSSYLSSRSARLRRKLL